MHTIEKVHDISDAVTPRSGETRQLAEFAAVVRYEDLPAHIVELAKYCLIDAVGCAIHGSNLPWSRMIAEYAISSSGKGGCFLSGALPRALPAPQAALCLGAFAHAFELDCLRMPGAGVHPGATVALPALMAAQSSRASGREVIAAIVAGCEVMFRIGNATLHTPENIGFHAPGITGPFGAATAAGRVMKLDAGQLTNAFGLAASMAAGILNFAGSQQGGMVKRLHLGRAAEAGVMACLLAQSGFEAPSQVVEGNFGILDVFCERSDASLLTRGLGEVFEIETLCFKKYACHVAGQAPIELLRKLMVEHGFDGHAVEALALSVSEKTAARHAERRPRDLMLAQYSVPFSLAVAALRDPEDPASFSADILLDEAILTFARCVVLRPSKSKGQTAHMVVSLKDGRMITGAIDGFHGCPESPLSLADLERKFRILVSAKDESQMSKLLSILRELETVHDCSAVF